MFQGFFSTCFLKNNITKFECENLKYVYYFGLRGYIIGRACNCQLVVELSCSSLYLVVFPYLFMLSLFKASKKVVQELTKSHRPFLWVVRKLGKFGSNLQKKKNGSLYCTCDFTREGGNVCFRKMVV